MEQKQYDYMYACEKSYWWFVGKQLCLSTVLGRFAKKSCNTILDIGCGTGGTTQMLMRWGPVLGIEPNQKARSYTKKRGIQVIDGSINRLPAKTNTYDIVTVLDVLYHRGVNEKRALSEVRRVLAKKGHAIFIDCAFPWLWSGHDDRMFARKRFTKPELVSIVQSAGLKVVYASYLFFLPFPLLVLYRFFQRCRRSTSDALPILPNPLNTVMKWIMFLESFLLRFVRFPWGSSVVVVAKKYD